MAKDPFQKKIFKAKYFVIINNKAIMDHPRDNSFIWREKVGSCGITQVRAFSFPFAFWQFFSI